MHNNNNNNNTASIRHEVTGLRKDVVQLRREVSQLRKGYNALRDKRDDLLAENRRLRKELDIAETSVVMLTAALVMAAVEEG